MEGEVREREREREAKDEGGEMAGMAIPPFPFVSEILVEPP
jgi:hypothetical protein